ncbi:MAG: hypothetical protein IPL23_01345 [Saprospiraceae bacterium]|nr:hypothetical protein [Saprospiraceae bacterium]
MTDLPVYHVNGKVETFEPNNLGYLHFIKIDHEIAEALFFNNTRRILLTDGIIAPLHMSISKNKDFYFILISKDLLKQFKKSLVIYYPYKSNQIGVNMDTLCPKNSLQFLNMMMKPVFGLKNSRQEIKEI